MKNNKYKILVLSDLKESASKTLKSSVSLAKMIHGDITFFHVKKATDVVERESQLSAIRTINKLHTTTSNEIQHLIDAISKDYDIKISHKHAFGNIKSEISEYLQVNKPDIVVIGKRKSNPFNFTGDNITDFVMKNHDGIVFIASDKTTLEPNTEISLGILNGIEPAFNLEFTKNLKAFTQKPLKSFTIHSNSNILKERHTTSKDEKTIEYVFEQGDNAINNLSNYLSKNNVDILCLDRESKNRETDVGMNEIINKVNISLLIANKPNPILN
jgi:vacuolar-type H+-ATPase subunit F/Vma7